MQKIKKYLKGENHPFEQVEKTDKVDIILIGDYRLEKYTINKYVSQWRVFKGVNLIEKYDKEAELLVFVQKIFRPFNP